MPGAFSTSYVLSARPTVSPARIALAWLLHQPAVTSVIIGAKRTDQLQDNLASVDVKLSPEELPKDQIVEPRSRSTFNPHEVLTGQFA